MKKEPPISVQMSGEVENTPSLLAYQFQKRIQEVNGIPHSSTTIFTFKDGSKLKFELSPNPNPQIDSAKGSDADQFASSVKGFTTKVDEVEFVFQDNSKLTWNLNGVATTIS